MVLGGLPLFLIELGIGQRLRTGPVGVWNAIHPYLGGWKLSFSAMSFLSLVILTLCSFRNRHIGGSRQLSCRSLLQCHRHLVSLLLLQIVLLHAAVGREFFASSD